MGSLFAGIGGFDLGFERAGFKTVWQVEINEYCRKVLARHFPDAERYADIRECGAHNLKPVDVICGGFPCQDISNAGLRAGIDGERSGLWREMHRVVRQLRPRYVVMENAAALLGRGMGRVLGDMAQIGYDSEWECVPAAFVGAPHLRDRVYVISYASGERQPKDYQHLWIMSPDNDCNSRTWNDQLVAKPRISRVADGIPWQMDRLHALGNAVVPQIPELIARRLQEVME